MRYICFGNKEKSFIKNINEHNFGICFLSFVLSVSVFAAILFYNDIFIGGRYNVLRGDLYSQYIDFINNFVHKIKSGDSILYSFSLYLGSGNALSNAYYVANPFNLLFLIPYISPENITLIIILFKIGLCSFSFSYFLCNFNKEKPGRWIIIFCSLCYSLCGFFVVFHFHIMWLDAFFILPVIIVSVKRLIYENKYISLIFLYFYLLISNFYMGYIVGIFSVICFIAILIYSYRKEQGLNYLLKKCLLYAGCGILAILGAAFVLIPCALFLFSHRVETEQNFTGLSNNILDILNSLFIGHLPSINNKVPIMYSGILSLILFPFYFLNKRITKKEKYVTLSVIIFLLISMLWDPLYKFMHAFDYPNYYAFRFSFCMTFVLVYVLSRILHTFEVVSVWKLIIFSSILMCLYYFMIENQKKRFIDGYFNTKYKMNINIIFIFIYIVLFVLFKFIHKKLLTKILLVITACAELFVNANLCFSQLGLSVRTEEFENWERAYEGSLDYIRNLQSVVANNDNNNFNGNSFYRIRVDNDNNYNSASYFNYYGLTSFSSSDEYYLRKGLSKLGIASGYHYIIEKGYTEITEMLLGAKYKITLFDENTTSKSFLESEDSLGNKEITDNDGNCIACVKENEALPLAFISNENVLKVNFTDNSFDNLNMLVSSILGEDIIVYSKVPTDDIVIDAKNVSVSKNIITKKVTKADTVSSNQNKKEYYVKYKCPHKEGYETYAMCFYKNTQEDWNRIKSLPLFYGKRQGKACGNSVLYNDIVKCKNDKFLNRDYFILSMGNGESFKYDDLYFYYQDNEMLPKVYDEINKNSCDIIIESSASIKIVADKSKSDNIIFTSIPYDEDWHCYVDDKKTSVTNLLDKTFIGIDLSDYNDGIHTITLKYVPKGLKVGVMLSVISWGFYILLCGRFIILKRKYKKL